MTSNKSRGRTAERTMLSLCDEIDELTNQVEYWQGKYEEEVARSNAFLNERLEESKRGVGMALMFAMAAVDNPDGSLSIPAEKRKELAESFNPQTDQQ